MMYRTLAGGSLALLGTLTWVAVDDYRAEWRDHQQAYAALTGAAVPIGLRQAYVPELSLVDRCPSCHVGLDDAAMATANQPLTSHPGTWLATHPPERFGCTPCHGGDGRATTTAAAGHQPGPDVIEPMVSPVGREARCGVCHREVEVAGAPHLSEGRKLLKDRGCVACHDVPGIALDQPFGEALDSVGDKSSRAWLVRWLTNPNQVRPGTKMPRFRLSDADTDQLATFLLSLRREGLPAADPLNEGDPEAGRSLFGQARCTTCHSLKGKGGTLGPALDRVGEEARPRWLVAWLTDPHALDPNTLMPHYGFSRTEVLDLAAYLLDELIVDGTPLPAEPEPLGAPEAIDAGRALFQALGCPDCHRLKELRRKGQSAPALRGIGGRSPHRLGFAGLPEGTHRSLSDWLYRKIERPEAGFPEAKMPQHGLEPHAIAAMTLALLSLRDVSWPVTVMPVASPTPAFEPRGAFGSLVSTYRCLSCHRLQGTGGDLSHAPLDREGSKVQPEWLEDFLVQPDTLRVAQAERMPNLRMPRSDAKVLSAIISNVYRDDRIPLSAPPPVLGPEHGRRLFDALGCRACHLEGSKGGYVGPDLARSGVRLRSGWVYMALLNPKLLLPDFVHPDYALGDGDAADLTAFLMTLRPEPKPSPAEGPP